MEVLTLRLEEDGKFYPSLRDLVRPCLKIVLKYYTFEC